MLSAPLTAPGAIGELALGLLAQPTLATSWVEGPAMGSLPGRRLAARILAHGAREAVRRHDAGDRGGVAVLARPGLRAALERLLADREALVWRFACIARGLLAHVDSDLAAAIDRELRPASTSTELRRAAASAAAALERGGAAGRWASVIVGRAPARTPASRAARSSGSPGSRRARPRPRTTSRGPRSSARRSMAARRSPSCAARRARRCCRSAVATALAWVRQQLTTPLASDDGRRALLDALDAELGTGPRTDGVGIPLAGARAALDAGDVPTALREARRRRRGRGRGGGLAGACDR